MAHNRVLTTLLRFLLFCLLIPLLFQQGHSQSEGRASTSLSLGILGYNGILGLNVDQLILRREKWNLGFRAGLPLYNPFSQATFPENRGKALSLGMNFLFGARTVHLDLSTNVGFFQDPYPAGSGTKVGTAGIVGFYAGFRYQRPGGGFFFKTGIAPSLYIEAKREDAPTLFLIPLLEFGYTVPNGFTTEKVRQAAAKREKKLSETTFPKVSVIASLGANFPTLLKSGSYSSSGQAGGTTVNVEEKKIANGLSGGMGLDLQLTEHFGLAFNCDFLTENSFIEWSSSSWNIMEPNLVNTTAGDLKLNISSQRLALWGKFYFGEAINLRAFGGPYLTISGRYVATGTLAYNYDGDIFRGDIDNGRLRDLRHLGSGLVPARTRLGLGGGIEVLVPITDQHGILGRFSGGWDKGRLFSYPGMSVVWANLQAGYSFTF